MPSPSHRVSALLCALGLAGLAFTGCSDDGQTEKAGNGSTESTPTTTTGTETTAKSKKGETDTDKSSAQSGSKGAKNRAPKKIDSEVNPNIKIPSHPSIGTQGGKSKGIPASASPFVGISVRAVPAAQARQAGPRAGKAGKWRLSMGEASYGLSNPDGTVLIGSLAKKGSRLVLGPLKRGKGRDAKACASSKGIYSWSADGRRLTFKKIDDVCGVRSVLSGGPWTNLSRR